MNDFGWPTLIGFSAVIGAVTGSVINGLFTLYGKWGDRRREDAKERQKIGYVYLLVALGLEAFARRCQTYISDIDLALHEMIIGQSSAPFAGLKAVTLNFEPEPTWAELPIGFVSDVKSLIVQYEDCGSWISSRFNDGADVDEAYELEQQRCAIFGLRAIELASSIRRSHQVVEGRPMSAVKTFTIEIDQCRTRFAEGRARALVPEVRQLLEAERAEGSG